MKKEENPTIGFRVPVFLKQKFEEITESETTQNKAEIFEKMINAYNDEKLKNQLKELEKDTPGIVTETFLPNSTAAKPEQEPEPVNMDQETDEDQETEITVKLTPAHVFMIKETILRKGFIDETNEFASYLNKENQTNFLDTIVYGNIFSGEFAGILRKLSPKVEDPKVMAQNMSDALLNLFVSEILQNSDNLSSPVTRTVLKRYLANQNKLEQLG